MANSTDIRDSLQAHLSACSVEAPAQAARARLEFARYLVELGLLERAANEARLAGEALSEFGTAAECADADQIVLGAERAVEARRILQELNKAPLDANELALIEAERMRTMGTVVGCVAHEINNPNHFTMLNIPFMREVWRDTRVILDVHAAANPEFRLANVPYKEALLEIPELLDELHQGAERIRDSVGHLRAYTQASDTQNDQALQLNEVVRRVLALLSPHLVRTTQHFVLELAPELPVVQANGHQLEQVIVSLLLHACRSLSSEEQSIRLQTSAEGEEVLLEVRYEGEPQANAVADLAVASQLIVRAGGQFSLRPEPGRGTRVTLRLPLPAERD